jgi:hypothetical protein
MIFNVLALTVLSITLGAFLHYIYSKKNDKIKIDGWEFKIIKCPSGSLLIEGKSEDGQTTSLIANKDYLDFDYGKSK